MKYGVTERALATQRSRQVRLFRKLETLVDYLKGVGIPRFDVDAANYDPHGVTATKRPDRAAAMKDAHAAAQTRIRRARACHPLEKTSHRRSYQNRSAYRQGQPGHREND